MPWICQRLQSLLWKRDIQFNGGLFSSLTPKPFPAAAAEQRERAYLGVSRRITNGSASNLSMQAVKLPRFKREMVAQATQQRTQ